MKVEEMTVELKKLSKIGETEPHAAYAAFTQGQLLILESL